MRFRVIWTTPQLTFLPFFWSRTNLPPTYLGKVKSTCFVVRAGNHFILCTLLILFTSAAIEDGKQVIFPSVESDSFALPDRRYLTLHAAVAKVVHMAGMADYLDDTVRKYENIRVLSDESHVEYIDGLLRIALEHARCCTV